MAVGESAGFKQLVERRAIKSLISCASLDKWVGLPRDYEFPVCDELLNSFMPVFSFLRIFSS